MNFEVDLSHIMIVQTEAVKPVKSASPVCQMVFEAGAYDETQKVKIIVPNGIESLQFPYNLPRPKEVRGKDFFRPLALPKGNLILQGGVLEPRVFLRSLLVYTEGASLDTPFMLLSQAFLRSPQKPITFDRWCIVNPRTLSPDDFATNFYGNSIHRRLFPEKNGTTDSPNCYTKGLKDARFTFTILSAHHDRRS